MKRYGFPLLMMGLGGIGGFLGGALIPLPAIRSFCLQCAIVFVLTTLTSLLVLPAIAALLLCRRERPKTSKEMMFEADAGIGTGTGSRRSFSLGDFIAGVYAPFVMRKSVRILAACVFLCLVSAGVWASARMRTGLSLTDVIPRHAAEHEFLHAQAEYFGFYNMYGITGAGFEYPGGKQQRLLHDYHAAFVAVEAIIKNDDGGLPPFWLQLFRDWLRGLSPVFLRSVDRRYIPCS